MKKLFTILAIALCSTLAMAQTNQYFWAGGQFIIGNPTYQIDSVTFGQLENTDSITLYLPHTIKVVHDTIIKYVTIHDTICSDEHQYVDLGLSVKWATCNVGASKPEDFGDYFAWGEITPKETYSWSNYKWCNGTEYSLTKYCSDVNYGIIDSLQSLELDDDAASTNWGGKWRMPTKSEMEELVTNCSWISTTNYNGTGVAGYIVTSNLNSNQIFIPSAGCIYVLSVETDGVYYWTKTLETAVTYTAWCLNMKMGGFNDEWRFAGRSVRPVQE